MGRTIGIIGGTGGMGRGFALRWCRKNDILVGSRDGGRAAEAAAAYAKAAAEAYGAEAVRGSISGADNRSVAAGSDVLVLSVPYEGAEAACAELLPAARPDCIVVSPIVPMVRTEAGFEFIPVKDGRPSSYDIVAAHARDRSMVVSAFHVISEKKLADPSRSLDCDIFVCGDGREAVEAVCDLVRQIEGLRPVRLGPGSLSYMAEIATPLLLNAMARNGIRNPGIKIV